MEQEELIRSYEEMLSKYGDQFPNSTHEPRRFLYYVRLMRWQKELNKYKFVPGVAKHE